MKKTIKSKKLVIAAQTVRVLKHDLDAVVGGGHHHGISHTCHPATTAIICSFHCC
jgi:hypothetical protein